MKLHFLLRKYFLLLVIVIAFVPCSIDSWVDICTLPKNVFTFSKLNFHLYFVIIAAFACWESSKPIETPEVSRVMFALYSRSVLY